MPSPRILRSFSNYPKVEEMTVKDLLNGSAGAGPSSRRWKSVQSTLKR
jgi:hypothetical protein